MKTFNLVKGKKENLVPKSDRYFHKINEPEVALGFIQQQTHWGKFLLNWS
jgi:hypothetical protein